MLVHIRAALLLVSCTLLPPAFGADDVPRVPHPSELDDPLLPTVVATARTQSGSGGPSDYLGIVQIQPALLTAAAARVQLKIAGAHYDLQFFDQKDDPRYGLRHVTMQGLQHEGAYARFSIDDRNGLLYGAIHAPDRVLWITPAQRPGYQDVHGSPPEIASSAPALRLLAWRHHELEALASIRPDYGAAHYESRTAILGGGNLGRVRSADVSNFVRAAVKLSSITQFTGAETFEIVEATTNGGGRQIALRQLIDGIPVDANNEMAIDGSGRILRLSTARVASDFVPLRPALSQAEAWNRAVIRTQALESGKLAVDGSSVQAALLYRPVTSMNDIALIYEFRFTTLLATPYLARVNAVDGTAEVTRLVSQ